MGEGEGGIRPAVERLSGHQPRSNAVAWNPADPCMIASCGDDGKVKMYVYHMVAHVHLAHSRLPTYSLPPPPPPAIAAPTDIANDGVAGRIKPEGKNSGLCLDNCDSKAASTAGEPRKRPRKAGLELSLEKARPHWGLRGLRGLRVPREGQAPPVPILLSHWISTWSLLVDIPTLLVLHLAALVV